MTRDVGTITELGGKVTKIMRRQRIKEAALSSWPVLVRLELELTRRSRLVTAGAGTGASAIAGRPGLGLARGRYSC